MKELYLHFIIAACHLQSMLVIGMILIQRIPRLFEGNQVISEDSHGFPQTNQNFLKTSKRNPSLEPPSLNTSNCAMMHTFLSYTI